MNKVICLLPIIPIRKEPDHRSEQTSQLLFGEKALVQNQRDNWIEIVTLFDSYTGWIEFRSVEELKDINGDQNVAVVSELFSIIRRNETRIYIPAGSEIPVPDSTLSFNLAGNNYTVDKILPVPVSYSRKGIVETSLQFMNAPYLWGGRTLFGIDCSGFVQTVFKIHGITLPRDTKDQVKAGSEIESLQDILPGDLIFFDNKEGIITHVGISIGENQVVHASLCVKIDRLDQNGIFNREKGEYTHRLRIIKRIK
jgi:hypothetical protein